MALPLLELDVPAAPSGQRWPGPLTPASLGNPKHACLFWQGSLEFPPMAGIGTGEEGKKRKKEGWLAGDSPGGVVRVDCWAGPA